LTIAEKKNGQVNAMSVIQTDLLTPEQVAKRLQVDVQLLNKWRSARKGPKFVKVGHKVRYDPVELQKWIDGQQVETGLKLV
jgi:hypothetical protein